MHAIVTLGFQLVRHVAFVKCVMCEFAQQVHSGDQGVINCFVISFRPVRVIKAYVRL